MTINYLEQILHKVNASIALFSKEGELLFFNNQLEEMWGIPKNFLQHNIYIVDFFEILREYKIYPPQDDFRKMCQQIVASLTKEDFEETQNILLPNGKNLEQKIIKYSDYLMFSWQDTTEVWDITYNLNNQKNLYNKIIEKNPQAIIVVSTTGQIEDYNGKFLQLFNISSENLYPSHIRDAFAYININDTDKPQIIGNILSNRSFSYTSNIDDKALVINGIALPNTSMFVVFSYDKTNKDIVFDSPELLKNLSNLQNDLVYDLNILIGNPLNSIIGFSEMLKNQYVGNLNIKQMEYINKILDKAQLINQELTYKLDLLELNQIQTIPKDNLDLNIVVAYILNQAKARISLKNINIKINFPPKLSYINSSESLLVKACSLFLLYIVDQNSNNAEITINIMQKNNQTIINIKDSAKSPILSDEDVKVKYDVILALNIFKKLNIKLDYSYKNKLQRDISIIVNN